MRRGMLMLGIGFERPEELNETNFLVIARLYLE
jgi:hypothetical protein